MIFDPVDGANPFLARAGGDRLINVAISRAQSQVVLFLSDGDLANKMLNQIASLASNSG